jgi:hypothetical protein
MPLKATMAPIHCVNPRPFTQQQNGQADREKCLQLNDERRQSRRQAEFHAGEQQRELQRELEQSVSGQQLPGNCRTLDEKYQRKRGKQEAQSGKEYRRQILQADLDDNEIEAPDADDGNGDQDIGDAHFSMGVIRGTFIGSGCCSSCIVAVWLENC